MHDPHSVETILSRLMPAAISEAGQREIEAMLDDLAGPPQAGPTPWRLPLLAGGIAAALTAAFLIFRSSAPAPADIAAGGADFLLVRESDRVESMREDGWREDADGPTMRALRVRVVEEDSLLDGETGIVMQVSGPREELLLMPVSAF
jgi:hypothetical protein